MSKLSHHDTVDQQFGAQAQAYVASTVHSQGADLLRLAATLAAAPVGRALDLGCGGGHVAYALAPYAQEVIAYDLSTGMLEAVAQEATKRGLTQITTVCGTAEQLPFPDNHFDFVCTRYSAHHWRDLDAGLREARRVLRPAGRFVAIDVISPEDPLYMTFLQTVEILRDPSHVKDYTENEWVSTLTRAGFTVEDAHSDKLAMGFDAWIARMKPPATHVAAIASLCTLVAPEILEYFGLDKTDRFDLDMIYLDCV